jgi:hypothetical protein
MRALVHREAGDAVGARAAASEAAAIGDRHGFAFWTLAGNLAGVLDPAIAHEPETEDRVAALMNVWRFAGMDAWTPAFLVEQGKGQLVRGNLKAALATLEEGAAIAERTGSLLVAAESARLIGEARLQLGDRAGVESIASAAQIAAEQGTKLFELRARTALRRHDPSQQDGAVLAALLAEVESGGAHDSPLAPVVDMDAARTALGT